MDTYPENSSTKVIWNWWENIVLGDYEYSTDENKTIAREIFCGELSSGVVSEAGEWLDELIFIW